MKIILVATGAFYLASIHPNIMDQIITASQFSVATRIRAVNSRSTIADNTTRVAAEDRFLKETQTAIAVKSPVIVNRHRYKNQHELQQYLDRKVAITDRYNPITLFL